MRKQESSVGGAGRRDGELSLTQLHTERVEVKMDKLTGKGPRPPTGWWQKRRPGEGCFRLVS